MDLFGNKVASTKECITPHKISLLVVILGLCDKEAGFSPFKNHRHSLMLILLDMIQATDVGFDELLKKLNEIDHHLHLASEMVQRLRKIQDCESNLREFLFKKLEDLLNAEGETLLSRTSFFGLFVRKMLLFLNKMSFGQILHLITLMEQYMRDSGFSYDNPDNTEPKIENSGSHQSRMPVSSRQAENFLTNQASLIHSYEQAAETPAKLQDEIRTILEGVPDLAEAYFVQYLNCVRVGEFNKAIDCLYHYFDRKQWEDNAKVSTSGETDETKKERCKRFCYAALNLAILHTHFNHRKEALTALQESIRIAQESNDHVCLAHGLRLLYKLNEDGDSHARHILERFRARAAELKLPYLESLSLLMKAKQMIFEGVPPPRVLKAFDEVNVLNSEKSLLDLAASSHVQQTACFEFYGKSNMAVVYSQFPLHHWKMSLKVGVADVLVEKSVGIVNSEATIHALCYLASHIFKQGNFTGSMKVLDFAKSIYPKNSKHSKLWQAQKQKICFDQAIIMEDWKGAEEAVNNLRVYEVLEADLQLARLNIKKELYDTAHRDLRKLLEHFEEHSTSAQEEKSTEELKANIHLAMGELHIATGNYSSSMTHLLKCKTTCDAYHMQSLSAIASLYIAEVQLELNLAEKAHALLNQVMIQILGHGSLLTRCCAKFLLTRCKLVQSQSQASKEARKSVLLSVLPTLDEILKEFKQMEAFVKIRQVLFYQAFIYNELDYTGKRNLCAIEFRSLYMKDGRARRAISTPL